MNTPFDLLSRELLNRRDLFVHDRIAHEMAESHKFLLRCEAHEVFAQFGDELIVRQSFRLPFRSTLFEFVASDERISRFVLLGVEYRERAWIIPFVRFSDASWSGGFPYFLYLDFATAEWAYSSEYERTDRREWRSNQRYVADAFAATVAMLGSNRCAVEHIGVSKKLSRSRPRMSPLFAYRVIKLPSFGPGTFRGGTHASPALHWRRGHFRCIEDRFVPVAPCLVGRIENGFVEKVYDATDA